MKLLGFCRQRKEASESGEKKNCGTLSKVLKQTSSFPSTTAQSVYLRKNTLVCYCLLLFIDFVFEIQKYLISVF